MQAGRHAIEIHFATLSGRQAYRQAEQAEQRTGTGRRFHRQAPPGPPPPPHASVPPPGKRTLVALAHQRAGGGS